MRGLARPLFLPQAHSQRAFCCSRSMRHALCAMRSNADGMIVRLVFSVTLASVQAVVAQLQPPYSVLELWPHNRLEAFQFLSALLGDLVDANRAFIRVFPLTLYEVVVF